jgi:hypothetical protein
MNVRMGNWLGQRFRIKKADSFWPIEPFFEFDAGHRTKKMVKNGRKVAFFDRNGSDLTSYENEIKKRVNLRTQIISPRMAAAESRLNRA